MFQIYFIYLHVLHLCDKMAHINFVDCVYVNITNCICSKNGKGPFLVLAIRIVKILIRK